MSNNKIFILLTFFLVVSMANAISQEINDINITSEELINVTGPYGSPTMFKYTKTETLDGKHLPKTEDLIKKSKTNVYERPYSFWDNNIDWRLVKADTYTVLGASVIGVGILYLMPESFTNWDKDDISISEIFSDWWENVKEGPVTDSDDWFLNWITHPYWGAVYYMAGRSAGASAPYSFLYSVILSTFFWEYGVEAFAEVPSKQDLIITPVVGSIMGEGFYLSKRHILGNDRYLLNSKILGNVTLFLMDPITEVSEFFLRRYDKKHSNSKDLAIFSFPTITSSGDFGYQVSVRLKF